MADRSGAENVADKRVLLSFFSGAMGLDIGLEDAGFVTRLACDNDKFCRETIRLNRPEIPVLEDVSDLSVAGVREAAGLGDKEEIDLMVGGPPCQAFSTAGKRKGLNDERGNVFLDYIDLALALKPKVFVIENVRGLLSCPMEHRPHDQRGKGYPPLENDEQKGGALHFILQRLKASGYSYSFELYNAANFGSPQVRERVVIVCLRGAKKEVPFLRPTHSNDARYSLPPWQTFRDAVEGLSTCTHLDFPAKRLKYYRHLKAGENWRALSDEMQREALGKSYFAGGGKTGFFRRLAWDAPAPTLVTHPAMPATDLAHPEENRPLSIEEYKRLQEFPDDWQLAGSLVQQYKQVGNAVPRSLGRAIGVLAAALIDGKLPLPPMGFAFSRYKRTSHEEWEADFAQRSQTLIDEQGRLPFLE